MSQQLGLRPFRVDFDTGGHFAAMETPGLLVHDVREFFGSLTSAAGSPGRGLARSRRRAAG